MLDVLRRNAGSWAIKIVLTFIAVTFIWWGVGTYTESDRNTAATVGKEKITIAELNEAAAGLEKVYRDVYGPAFTPEMAKALDLRRQALDTLVRRTILLSEAKKIGLSASDAEVQREIAATPAFQVDGVFREDRYRSVLQYNRVAPAEYEAAKRQEITLRKMEGLIAAGGRVSEPEARDYFAMTGRRVRLLAVTADPAQSKENPAVSRDELEAHFARAKESYRIPARVALLVAKFEPLRFEKGIEPTAAEIQSYYEGNPDKFRTEEERLVARIEIPFSGKDKEAARKKATQAAEEGARGKAEFEAAAKRYGRGKPVETWLARKAARPEVAEAVFRAPVDTVVGPVEVPGAYLVLRVNRIKFPEAQPLDRVRDRAAALLRSDRAKDVAVVKAYEAHAAAQKSHDLRAACAPYGVTVVETGLVGGGDSRGAVPPAVIQEALALSKGEIGPVKTIGDTHYLFQVAGKEESRLPSLSEVEARVRAAVVLEKRRQAEREKIARVVAGARSAADLERAARAARFPVTASPFFSPLADPLPEVVAETGATRNDILSLSGAAPVFPRVLEARGKFAAVALLEEKEASPQEWAGKKDAVMKELAERKRAQLLEAFLSARRREVKVEVNPEALR